MNDLYEKVREKLLILNNMYDVMRIIDPINKNVINISNQPDVLKNSKCYELLDREEMCKNCISVRVEVEMDTFIKLEYVSKDIILIIATFISINGKRYIVEIIKNITAKKNRLLNDNDHICMKNVIENLNEKVIRDESTGAYNRIYIESRLPVDINNSIFNDNNLSLIMIEIDEFENVNDKYGQEIESKILRDVSEIINKSVEEESYWIGRYSKNKYIIVLNNTDQEYIITISNEIKSLLKDISFEYNNKITKLNVHWGIYSSKNQIIDIRNVLSDLEAIISEEKHRSMEKIIKEQKLSTLDYRIQELRDLLNEMTISSKDKDSYEEILKISQDLDELIVEYMKNAI